MTSNSGHDYKFLDDEEIDANSQGILETVAAYWALCEMQHDQDKLQQLRDIAAKQDETVLKFVEESHPANPDFKNLCKQFRFILNADKESLKWSRADAESILTDCIDDATLFANEKELNAQTKKLQHILKVRFAAVEWTDFNVVYKWTSPDPKVEQPENAVKAALSFDKLRFKKLSDRELPTFEGVLTLDEMQKSIEVAEATQSKKSKKRKIKAAGETRANVQKKQKTQVTDIECPITGKMIPAQDFDDHLKKLLADPNFKTQRDAYKKKHRLTNLTNAEVTANLKRLVKRD